MIGFPSKQWNCGISIFLRHIKYNESLILKSYNDINQLHIIVTFSKWECQIVSWQKLQKRLFLRKPWGYSHDNLGTFFLRRKCRSMKESYRFFNEHSLFINEYNHQPNLDLEELNLVFVTLLYNIQSSLNNSTCSLLNIYCLIFYVVT